MSGTLEPPFGGLDPAGMAAHVAGAAEQIEGALERIARAPWRPPLGRPDLVAVGAMGGSAIAADLTAALHFDRLPHPLLVVREYRWPACVTAASLAVLSSYSGDTEETLALYDAAGARGVPRVAITTGGELGRRCAQHGVPVAELPPGMPPRAALWASWVTLVALLHALGWVDDPTPAWRETAERLRARRGEWGPQTPEGANAAKRLARSMDRRFVHVVAASERLGPVATRVRNQINENAKLLGHSALVPEINHNEIVGWERAEVGGSREIAWLLRDAEDPPVIRLRLTLTAEHLRERGVSVVESSEAGGCRLARLASLIQLGDYVSLYLAFLNGADPSRIASIDRFKSRLAAERSTHAG